MRTTFAFLLGLALAPQFAADATLDGRVLNAVTGDVVATARVRIRPVAGGIRLTAVADAAGVFHFDGLAPGRYGLQIEHPNYVRGLGRGRSAAFQAIVDIAAGDRRRNVVVRIAPNGSVEGTVTAESGEPVDRCAVELLQFEFRDGQRRRMVQGTGTTDGRGRFHIADVTPGAYSVRARCAPNPVPFRPLLPANADSFGPSLGFAPALRSGLVRVESGRTTRDIDIQVHDSLMYPLGGTVTMPLEARSAASVQIALFPDGPEEEAGEGAVATPANPNFRIAAALPGRYWLVAFAKVGDALYTARQAVSVGEDAPPVDVRLSAGLDVSGIIEMRSAGRSSGRRLSGTLIPSDSLVFEPRSFASSEDGDFIVRGIPAGVWRLGVPSPDPGFYLQSVLSGDHELTSSVLAIAAATPLRVVFSDGAGSIDGAVLEPPNAERPPQRTIVLEPLFTPSFLEPEDLLTTAGADGRFRIEGLPPNRYRLYVLPGLDREVALDPELLRALEAYSRVVTVGAGRPTIVTGTAAPDAAVSAALDDR